MSVGDDNVLGGNIDKATKVLKKLKGNSDKEICKLAGELLQTLNGLETNVSIVQTDEHSLMRYIMMLTNPTVGKNTLRFVYDALSSFSDDTGE
jgi:hypothetical protein